MLKHSSTRKGISQTEAVLVLVIIILGIAVAYYAFFAQPRGPTTIRGILTNELTGDPLSGVTVTLDGRSVTTGQDGTYVFSVEPGDYQVTAGVEDTYETQTLSVSATEAKEYTFDFQFTPMKRFRVALMIGGDETDLGFSFMAIQGANNLRDKFGWEVDISRQIAFADQARVTSDYATRGYDLVIAVGGQFIQTLYFEIPQQYPDTYFAQIPGLSEPAPPQNVVALGPAFQVNGHYLAGVLSAEMTQTDSLGWICGQWFPYIAMEYYAFKAGAESVNPDIKVYARVAGTWEDASIGFEIASALIETKNVDIIVQVADLTGRGIIAASQAKNIKVIGTVADQASIAPNITLTSILMDTPQFMEMVAENVLAGTFEENMGGRPIDIDISGLAPFHQFENIVPQSTKDLLQATEDGINSGAIQVPITVTSEPPSDPP